MVHLRRPLKTADPRALLQDLGFSIIKLDWMIDDDETSHLFEGDGPRAPASHPRQIPLVESKSEIGEFI